MAEATGKMTQLCRKIVRVNIREANSVPPLSRRSPPPSPSPETIESGLQSDDPSTAAGDSDSDLVSLKICVMGDCQIGKTSFLIKYVGDEQEKKMFRNDGIEFNGQNINRPRRPGIAFSIWDVEVIILHLLMFQSLAKTQWRSCSCSILPVDPSKKVESGTETIDIASRGYARAMKATLFFSSATHNINVNKIFKFIMAKLFNLPWTVQRNLTIGEPIIDF
ncbi:Septum-promoting GTP-binding protein 1 [Vitis vinifera]|uniref:Septum-promoting GTP-binding protein 1 n=1 Tax=Vitis vinifera TaxID=29760 RepID=A0A438J4P1_VITVI|nr:Septum-promoting GTP-binding protein 1 [Vitis vinifera]